MVCSQCGEELKKGVKFCTKCGTSSGEKVKLTLLTISIILSVIGIVGFWGRLIPFVRDWITQGCSFSTIMLFFVHHYYTDWWYFSILPFVAVLVALVALVAQKKQKSVIGFVAGIIPCVYLIIMQIIFNQTFWG